MPRGNTGEETLQSGSNFSGTNWVTEFHSQAYETALHEVLGSIYLGSQQMCTNVGGWVIKKMPRKGEMFYREDLEGITARQHLKGIKIQRMSTVE